MPRLRRLSGQAVRALLEELGFEVVRVKGSHHIMRRTVTVGQGDDTITQRQTISVPIHGRQTLPIGTLRAIVRSLAAYIPEDELESRFYVS